MSSARGNALLLEEEKEADANSDDWKRLVRRAVATARRMLGGCLLFVVNFSSSCHWPNLFARHLLRRASVLFRFLPNARLGVPDLHLPQRYKSQLL